MQSIVNSPRRDRERIGVTVDCSITPWRESAGVLNGHGVAVCLIAKAVEAPRRQISEAQEVPRTPGTINVLANAL